MTAPLPPDTGSLARRSSLRRDTAFVAIGQLSAVLSAFLLTLAGARLLTPEDFGSLSWALSWLGYLAVLAQFGLTQLVTIHLAAEDTGAHRRLLQRLLLAQAISLAAVGIVWFGVIGPMAAAAGVPPEAYAPLVLVVALSLPAAAVGPVVVNALRARGRFGLSLVFGEHVRRLVLIGVLVVLAVTARTGPSVQAALWWTAAIETMVYLLGVLILIRVVGGPPRGGHRDVAGPSPWRLLRRGSAFSLATLASATVPQAGIWLLATIAPVHEVAIFAVAVRVAVLFGVPTAVGMRTLAPRVAAASAAGRLQALQRPIQRFAAWSTMGTVSAVLLLALTGGTLMPAVFGAGYGAALAPALLMSVGVVINAWTGPCSVVLSHAGHQGVVAVSSLISAVGFLALSVWWGSIWGAEGVAAAAAAAMGVRNCHLAYRADRTLGIRTIALPGRRGR